MKKRLVQKFFTVLQSSPNQLESTMGIICVHALGYDNILLSKDDRDLQLAIHSMNATVRTTLSSAQVQTLIDALQKVLDETAA